jgi:Domain of unknown function (DUF4178)
METALAIVIFAALIVAGAIVFMRGRRQQRTAVGAGAGGRTLAGGAGPAPTPEQAATADVRRLAPGDVVLYEGTDFIVEGTIRLEQGGFSWQEHRLAAGERSLWLSVEDDEGLEVVVWDRGRAPELEPGPKTLTHDGVDYALEERGEARFTAEGSTGTGASGRVEYVDYEAGPRRLGFERYGEDGSWEVGVGTVVSEHALDVYPARR